MAKKKDMTIACLGWGSLVWDPRDLLVRRPWFPDGPLLPVEFCRKSQNGRVTLVITDGKPKLRTLWAIFSSDILRDAILSLRKRELNGSAASIARVNDGQIGCWERGSAVPRGDRVRAAIRDWAINMGLDAVLWTELASEFYPQRSTAPSQQDVVAYLSGLKGKSRQNAKTYVRRAPAQIDTNYRRAIEKKLGWKPILK